MLQEGANREGTAMTVEISEGFIWPVKGDRLLRAEDDWDKAVNFAEEEIARGVHIWDGSEAEPRDRRDPDNGRVEYRWHG